MEFCAVGGNMSDWVSRIDLCWGGYTFRDGYANKNNQNMARAKRERTRARKGFPIQRFLSVFHGRIRRVVGRAHVESNAGKG